MNKNFSVSLKGVTNVNFISNSLRINAGNIGEFRLTESAGLSGRARNFAPLRFGALARHIFIALFLLLFLLPWGLFSQDNSGDDSYTEIPFWRQALGGAVIGRPAAQVESVVMATDGGNLKSYSWQGRPLWDYYARGRLTPYVSRSREGTSYICRINGMLIAVNRVGRELWRLNLRSPLVSPVLTGWDGRLFIFTDRRITCTTASGYTLWSRALEKKSILAPIRDVAGGVIMIQEDGELLSFDPFGNAYSYKMEAIPVAAASLEIEDWGPTVLLLYEDRNMELVYTGLKYGESFRGKLDLPSVPLAAAGRKNEAAVLMKDGRVVLLTPEDKIIQWISQPGHIRAGELPDKPGAEDLELLFDERGIYVLTKNGATGYTADGRRLWNMRLRGSAAIPTFGDDGIIYSGGADWILYAYRLEDRVRARQRVLYGEASEGSYGTRNPGPSSRADYYFRFEERELEARLNQIRQAVRAGSVGANEKEYLAWLMETAGSYTANLQNRNQPLVQPRHRVEAASLLAYIGSRETIPFLADLVNRDPEIVVKAAAAEAIGRIGVDPEGIALRTFENLISPPSISMDESLLTPIARATGALCRFSGPPLGEPGVRILTLLMRDDMPSGTRRQAMREITSLR